MSKTELELVTPHLKPEQDWRVQFSRLTETWGDRKLVRELAGYIKQWNEQAQAEAVKAFVKRLEEEVIFNSKLNWTDDFGPIVKRLLAKYQEERG